MVRAYVLIEAESGCARDVTSAVRSFRYPGANVVSVDPVMGPFDVVAMLETDDMDRLGKAVGDGVRHLPGIRRTVTCLAVHLA